MHFTPESAQAAMQLGPVEFTCNTCGMAHVAPDDNRSRLFPCVLGRCRMAWDQAYRDRGLDRMRLAADELRHVVNCVLYHSRYVASGTPTVNLAWTCMGHLADVFIILDPVSYGEDRDGIAKLLLARVRERGSLPWLLMTPPARADAEIALALPGLLSSLCRLIYAALRDARCLFPLCDYQLSLDLDAACRALHAELDRVRHETCL